MKVILLSGKSASGKDQFGKYLYDILDRKDLRVLTIHYADFVKYCCTQYYDWDGNKDVYGRSLLQRIGTDIVRKKFPSYWAECVAFHRLRSELHPYAFLQMHQQCGIFPEPGFCQDMPEHSWNHY